MDPDARTLNRDTTVCISLSGRPSNIGTRFHNHLYNDLGLDFVYKAFTAHDLVDAVAGIRGLGIRGAGISMPYKEAVIPMVDVMHDSASAIESVNTIVNDDGTLHAYNTDYQAVANLLRDSGFDVSWDVAVAGSGGMAKAVVAAVRDSGFGEITVVSRNPETGRELADKYDARWVDALGGQRPRLLINATPIGMSGGSQADDLPFTHDAVATATAGVDVVAMPPDTPFARTFRDSGRPVITGDAVIALQAAEQFVLYTGVRPTDEQIAAASEYSRR
ncbi:shikimate 5-dehydrogenase [Williamsia sterculiae]|uniref:Shikimate dehydrogenase n=1 Tax=Williamsia sterculiae TaxID=1344003 RepID=A0A1N7E289_9NOCA|nr:shikimate 5-dehydrogenase [Williamsia sterculiae]SIR82075.1 shikimate dehydrogenase [Williamsia sterculiae]